MLCRWLSVLGVLIAVLSPPVSSAIVADETPTAADGVLATVGGRSITAEDLRFLMTLRRVPDDRRPAVRARFLQELIDRELIRAFLEGRHVEIGPEILDAQVRRVLDTLREDGGDPREALARLGVSEEMLRAEIALPLTWEKYVRQVTTPQRVREFFEQHQSEFDGTRVRVSQVFLKAPEGENAVAALARLTALREQIESGRLTFAEAARRHSESPSRENGGDMGFSTYRGGRLPAALADAAFDLKVGEISPPIRTPFGVHLLTVTERTPGDLSLEDARPAVMERLSRARWDETVADLRKTTRIERPSDGR